MARISLKKKINKINCQSFVRNGHGTSISSLRHSNGRQPVVVAGGTVLAGCNDEITSPSFGGTPGVSGQSYFLTLRLYIYIYLKRGAMKSH